MTLAFGALERIEEYSVDRRLGRALLMMYCASSIAPLQSLIHAGCAHSVRTSAKPASLPPTEIVTCVVVALSALSWLLVTLATVAPEQAGS